MLDKLLHEYGFEGGLGVFVAGVWALTGRGVAMLVLGTFLVVCSLLSSAKPVDLKTPLANAFSWVSEFLSRPKTGD